MLVVVLLIAMHYWWLRRQARLVKQEGGRAQQPKPSQTVSLMKLKSWIDWYKNHFPPNWSRINAKSKPLQPISTQTISSLNNMYGPFNTDNFSLLRGFKGPNLSDFDSRITGAIQLSEPDNFSPLSDFKGPNLSSFGSRTSLVDWFIVKLKIWKILRTYII